MFNKNDTQIALVCAYNISKNPNSKTIIGNYLYKAKALVKNYTNSSFSITTIQSEEFISYKQLHKHFNQIDELSTLRAVLGINTNYTVKYLNNINNRDYFEISNMIVDLCDSYNKEEYMKFNNILKKTKNKLSHSILLNNMKIKNSIHEFLYYSTNFKFNQNKNIDCLLEALHKHGEKLLNINHNDKSNYIEEIKSFINENYMNDIGINTIAETLNLTPNYLSSLFHKTTGMKFTDYITEVRILKSKKLLIETDMTIKEITKKVGYHSSRHFTKLFLKHIKCYPSEYRKKREI